MREPTLAGIDSSRANALDNQENHVEKAKRRKRSRLAGKTADAVSLNASTIGSKDTVESNNANTTMLEETLKPRWILQSGESQKFKIRYQPEEMGTHRHTYALSVIDGDDITYEINVSGIADVPGLDMNPNVVFSKVEESKIAEIHDPAYFSDTGAYDFGSLLVFRKDKSEHRREAEFKFRNVSKVDAEVCFYLEENIPDIFILEEEKLHIPAGQRGSLKISAGVTKLGSFTDKLHICVTNNPHVDTIQLRCSGSKLDIELEDKQVSFGQVLLYRRDFLTRAIRNRSPVQILWRLMPDESLDPQISFAPISGIVKAGSDQEIEFCYHASKVGAVDASLTFDAFFIDENDVESIFTESLSLSGETYDVAVDINHVNPIDLKYVKVGCPTSANFTISNRGNYEVKYVILLDEPDKLAMIAQDLPAKLKENIEISPASGFIESQKEATVQKTPIEHPSVTYMTQIKKENIIQKDSDKMTDNLDSKDKKQSPIESSSTKKIPEFTTKLQVGPFTVTKTEGDVAPGIVDTVTIECYPEFVGSQEEQILIFVPDSVPEDRSGKLVTLSVNSCLPSVDLYNLDAMFRENYIVNRIQDFICPKEIDAHTVFARQERRLYFRHIKVYHTHTTYFELYNRNVIPANVEITLYKESSSPVIFQPDAFVVAPDKQSIPPMSQKKFAVTFKPTLLETSHAVLGIEVEQPSHLKDEKFSVKLTGQACVPEVTIVEPPNGKRERAVLNFGRTLVNDTDTKSFVFQNVGVVSAKVIVEIYEDPKCLFTIGSHDDNDEDSTDGRDYGAERTLGGNRCLVVHLTPGQTVSLDVKFSPREVGKYVGLVRLFVADNPYENLTIDLKAEVYAELIVLEGLKLVSAKSTVVVNERRESNFRLRRSSSRSDSVTGVSLSTALPVSLTYKLEYGCCFVNKIYRKSFKITNKSADRHLRFQWGAHPNVVFTPSIGHLKSSTCKEIIATFLSSEPASYVDVIRSNLYWSVMQ
ncbi:Hydrocephalus-inducing protein [Harpegnathos saltator]|uniref:Hydrocephalus-inducing protein n=1 Tax=Harpegnathos saltator TaxID=610380 RepID=E2BEQ6_HARSA|nr:Hydrocephalus-inducing protein [Harpegnathos saltator]